MTKSYEKDIQLLIKILQNQDRIKKVIKDFKCTEHNLINNEYAFDLCALYMSQIGEAAKYLTDSTKESFVKFDYKSTSKFRDLIDHIYEKVNRNVLKAYIFSMAKSEVTTEIKNRITYCRVNKRNK